MNSIVVDYRKCVSTIDSCKNNRQLLNCDNLIKAFRIKHNVKKSSWPRYRELSRHLTQRLREYYQNK